MTPLTDIIDRTYHISAILPNGEGTSECLVNTRGKLELIKESMYLCGHVHGLFDQFKSPTEVSVINVGVDVRNFMPISEEDISAILASGLKKGNYDDSTDRHNR